MDNSASTPDSAPIPAADGSNSSDIASVVPPTRSPPPTETLDEPRRPPPPPPPPPPPTDNTVVILPDANITVVRTAAELQQALEEGARDIELQDHIDTRGLPLTETPFDEYDLFFEPCKRHYGVPSEGCDVTMHVTGTRSLRGNCRPPTAQMVEDMNLPEGIVASMGAMLPGQCVVAIENSWLQILQGSIWLDNLHVTVAPRTLLPQISAVVVGGPGAKRGEGWFDRGVNLFITRSTFQSSNRISARALEVRNDFLPGRDPFSFYLRDVVTHLNSILVQGCRFIGFGGGEPPVLVSLETFATFRNCTFEDLNLSVEVFDVSYGGMLHLDACSFYDVKLRQGKLVGTTNNDAIYCDALFPGVEGELLYLPEDDAAYDIPLESLDPSNPASGMHVGNATLSDCLRRSFNCPFTSDRLPINEWVPPGCPQDSVQRRKNLEKSRCMGLLSPDYEEYVPLSDYNKEYDPVDSRIAPAPQSENPFPGYDYVAEEESEYSRDYEAALPGDSGENFDWIGNFTNSAANASAQNFGFGDTVCAWDAKELGPGAVQPDGSFFQYAFMDDSNAWLQGLQKVLPEYEDIETDTWLWPQRLQQQNGTLPPAPLPTPVTQLPRNAALLLTCCGVLALACCCACILVWRRRRRGKASAETSEGKANSRMVRCSGTRYTVPNSSMNPLYTFALDPDLSLLKTQQLVEEGSVNTSELQLCERVQSCEACTRGLKGPIMHAGRRVMNEIACGSMQAPRTVTTVSIASHTGPLEPPTVQIHTTGDPVAPHTTFSPSRDPLSSRNTSYSTAVTSSHLLRTEGRRLFAPAHPQGESPHSASHTSTDPTPHDRNKGFVLKQCDTGVCAATARREEMATGGAPLRTSQALQVKGLGLSVLNTHAACSLSAIVQLGRQLDRFTKDHLFLGQFEMLGRGWRRTGGQAVVQFVRRAGASADDERQYAVKFFLDRSTFYSEAALYAAYFPTLRRQLEHVSEWEPSRSSGFDAHTSKVAGGRFLPHVEAVCDSAEAGLVDPMKEPLPPCIVMERGESLHDCCCRAELCRFTCLAVLSDIAERITDMHEAGYAHRDLKPANVIRLPRENRWTVIDFGCAARIGTLAPLAFTLTYAPPEILCASESKERKTVVTAAVDVWALGVMAFELLTGEPAFSIATDGSDQVVAALLGEVDLPWEGEAGEGLCRKLGSLRAPILSMLHRDPCLRPSLDSFLACLVQVS